jgi:hypothetical protein
MNGPHYRLEDARIAGAAADVAREAFADLSVRRIRVSVEEFQRGHDHARSADAALGGSVSDEGLLDVVESGSFGDAFDGLNAGALDLQDRDETTVHEPSVEHDGTGAALPFPAAFLGSGEAQVLAENIEKAGHGPGFDFAGVVVDGEADESLRHRDLPG